MIINEITPETLSNEKTFGITNFQMVFDILRNKIYSDSKLAVCREIMCNARDANVEVGNGNIPIVVSCPTEHDMFYRVKDNGPGISPDRMENIYINYGSSSKRDSSEQVGFFGLGAKSPFAYTNAFEVHTVVDNIKYEYIAFIDETKIGKIILSKSFETNECNGTEIIVPVEKNDIGYFVEKTAQVSKYWDVEPIIKNGIKAKRFPVIISCKNGFFEDTKVVDAWHSERPSINVIMGGIFYKLDEHKISELNSYLRLYLENCRLNINLNIGDINLAANRESVSYDEKLTAILLSKLKSIKEDVKKVIQEDINSKKSLHDAYLHFLYIKRVITVNEHLYYNDISLNELHEVKSNIYLTNIYFPPGKTKRITRSISCDLLYNKCFHIINDADLDEIKIKKIVKEKGFEKVNIVRCKEEFDDILQQLGYVKSSTLVVNKVQKTYSSRTMFFMYKGNDFSLISAKDVKNKLDTSIYISCNKDSYSKNLLKELIKINPNYKFISSNNKEALNDLCECSVEDLVKDLLSEVDCKRILVLRNMFFSKHYNDLKILRLTNLDKIKMESSCYKRIYTKIQNLRNELSDKMCELVCLSNTESFDMDQYIIDNKELLIKADLLDLEATYELLADAYYLSEDKYARYINMVDFYNHNKL